jgi:alpha-ribazole phosphatase
MNIKRPNSKRRIICLLRHGDSRRDEVKRFIGQTDTPLNETGREQAAWWRGQFSGLPFNRIYCSDLSRSLQTAEIIAASRDEPVQALAELREINLGTWDGLSMQEVRSTYPMEFEKRGADIVPYRTEGGESFVDLRTRIMPFFERILSAEENERVLVVGHAGVNRTVLCHILGMPLQSLFRFGQDYGCLNVITCEADSLRLHALNIPPGNSLAAFI